MISETRQRFAMAGMVAVAGLAIVLAAAYQDDNKLDQPSIVGGNPAVASGSNSGAASDGSPGGGPIEGFLPQSGEASACREDVGVDLADGFGAKLTINGVEVPPEALNVNLNADGTISNVVTASRSLGQYTFKPDDDCPNGPLLRPVDNVLEVCVFRLSDASQRCAVRRENVFDAL